MVWGSWTELMVGLGTFSVAFVLGFLAWKEAKEATWWAKRATELQEKANELAEAALPIAFTAAMESEIYHDGDQPGQPFDAWLVLRAEEGTSPALVHRVETDGAFLREFDARVIPAGEMFGKWEVEPNPDEELPRRLHPSEPIYFANPWPSFTPNPVKSSWANVRVYFSATAIFAIRDVQVAVDLPTLPSHSDPT